MHAEVFKGKRGFHWRFRNRGRVTADSESFPSRANAMRAAKAVVRGVIGKQYYPYSHPATVMFESAHDPARPGVIIVRWS